MRMCKNHWGMLRKAIEDCGLGRLIAKDGAALARSGGDDPLFRATAAICGNAFTVLGPEVTRIGDEDCPLCYLNRECTCPVPDCANIWITYAARDEKEMYDIIRKQQSAILN